MFHAQFHKMYASVPTAAVGSTATTTLTIDRLGYDHVSISAIRGANSATTFANVLKVEESDNDSSYDPVTALVGGGTGGFTIPAIPAAQTSLSSVVQLDIDARARKRYLRVSMTPGASATLALVASASKAEEAPVTVAEKGVVGHIVG